MKKIHHRTRKWYYIKSRFLDWEYNVIFRRVNKVLYQPWGSNKRHQVPRRIAGKREILERDSWPTKGSGIFTLWLCWVIRIGGKESKWQWRKTKKGQNPWNETKENLWTRVRTSGEIKHAPFLANPICTGQAQQEGDKTYKKGKPRRIEASPLGLAQFSRLKSVLSSACWIKLNCNQAVTLGHHFKSLLLVSQNWENYALSQYIIQVMAPDMLGECGISSVLSHGSKELKWWTSVTACLQLSFIWQRVDGYTWGLRAGWP